MLLAQLTGGRNQLNGASKVVTSPGISGPCDYLMLHPISHLTASRRNRSIHAIDIPRNWMCHRAILAGYDLSRFLTG